jgi:hypothetical protein
MYQIKFHGPMGSPVPEGFRLLGYPLTRGYKYEGPRPREMGPMEGAALLMWQINKEAINWCH